MAAAAGSALLRSVASRIARAPPPHQHQVARGLHGRRTGPRRPYRSSKGRVTRDEKVENKSSPSTSELWVTAWRKNWDWNFRMWMFFAVINYGWVKPLVEEFRGSFKEIRDRQEQIRQEQFYDSIERQIEAAANVHLKGNSGRRSQ